eukprot:852504-Heterocapsa_arctica.AAC.1
MQGAFMPMAFNDSLMVFAPKDTDSAQDINDGVRLACDTRPLSLKNYDNKLICSAINFSLKRLVSVWACELQRGF